MAQMMENGLGVHVYKHNGQWLDIGRVDDFQRAQEISWDEQSTTGLSAVAA
jgi:mannose-1-phosphate guanylyltransferase